MTGWNWTNLFSSKRWVLYKNYKWKTIDLKENVSELTHFKAQLIHENFFGLQVTDWVTFTMSFTGAI